MPVQVKDGLVLAREDRKPLLGLLPCQGRSTGHLREQVIVVQGGDWSTKITDGLDQVGNLYVQATYCIAQPAIPVATAGFGRLPAETPAHLLRDTEEVIEVALEQFLLRSGHLASRNLSSTQRLIPLAIRPFQEASRSPPVAASETPVPTTTSARPASSALSASVTRAAAEGAITHPSDSTYLSVVLHATATGWQRV